MRATLALALVLIGCPSSHAEPAVTAGGEATEDAAGNVRHPAFAALLEEHWQDALTENPVLGTLVGDHRRDSEMPDVSHEAELRRRATRSVFLDRATQLTSEVDDASDRITLHLFIDMLEMERDSDVCESHLWNASAMDNPVVALNRVAPLAPPTDSASAAAYLGRMRAFARLADQTSDNLRRGASEGRTAPRATLERLVEVVEGSMSAPLSEWVALTVASEAALGADQERWPSADRDAFLAELRTVLDQDLRAAFGRYLDTVRALVPEGRGGAHEGVSSLPAGADCYRAEIHRHTTLRRRAEDLHALGVQMVAASDARLLELGGARFGAGSVAEIVERLRTDASLGYPSEEAIVEDVTARIREAEARAPEFFTRRAETACEVRTVPPAEAARAGFAFYVPGAPDGSRPGAYYVNTANPTARPRHLVAAITAHEAVPGHHFQITVAQSMSALPAFRRHGSFTAYVEGWGLYAERLADEMGLYHDDLDRMGAVDTDAFRSARLVVDTGLHTMGWTRAAAETYMLEHTSMSRDLVVNEVDRYINWPGQALAYKVGQLEIVRLRERAAAALGDRFDLRAFHDLVLGIGPVTMHVLEQAVEEWIAASAASEATN